MTFMDRFKSYVFVCKVGYIVDKFRAIQECSAIDERRKKNILKHKPNNLKCQNHLKSNNPSQLNKDKYVNVLLSMLNN